MSAETEVKLIKHPDTLSVHPLLVNTLLSAFPDIPILDVQPDLYTDYTPKMFINGLDEKNCSALMPAFISGKEAEHQLSIITKVAHTLKFKHPHDERTPWIQKLHLLLSDFELRGNKPTMDESDNFVSGAELHYAYYLNMQLQMAGVDSVTLLDPHDYESANNLRELGIETTCITAMNSQVEYLAANDLLPSDTAGGIVIADDGSIGRALYLSEITGLPIIGRIIKARRNGSVKIAQVLGAEKIAGKRILLPDDILATGGTLIKDSSALKELGADTVTALITHTKGVSIAPERIRAGLSEAGPINNLLITNSTPYMTDFEGIPNIHVVDIMPAIVTAAAAIFQSNDITREELSKITYFPLHRDEAKDKLARKFPSLSINKVIA